MDRDGSNKHKIWLFAKHYKAKSKTYETWLYIQTNNETNRLCFRDADNKKVNAKMNEIFENMHGLIMEGRYNDACEIFEKWFHEKIGSGIPPPYITNKGKTLTQKEKTLVLEVLTANFITEALENSSFKEDMTTIRDITKKL